VPHSKNSSVSVLAPVANAGPFGIGRVDLVEDTAEVEVLVLG
jgi:hypothetical protein